MGVARAGASDNLTMRVTPSLELAPAPAGVTSTPFSKQITYMVICRLLVCDGPVGATGDRRLELTADLAVLERREHYV